MKPAWSKQRLLVVQDAGGDAVGNADQLAVVTRGLLAAAEEIIPVEGRIALGDVATTASWSKQMRRHPAGHLHRPLGDVDAR